jgi:hypothetical protein
MSWAHSYTHSFILYHLPNIAKQNLETTKKIEADKHIIEYVYPLLNCPKGDRFLNSLVIDSIRYTQRPVVNGLI